MKTLVHVIESSMPELRENLPPNPQIYHQHREQLSTTDGVAMYKDRIIIPPSLVHAYFPASTQLTIESPQWSSEPNHQFFGRVSLLTLTNWDRDVATALLHHNRILLRHQFGILTIIFNSCAATSSTTRVTTTLCASTDISTGRLLKRQGTGRMAWLTLYVEPS